jgi:flagellar biosynthesis protein FlhG
MSLRDKRLWTIGGGKGGVGKSFLAASMGTALARAGKSVILVDANLAAPDLHAYLGVQNPDLTLLDVLARRAALPDVLISTPEPRMRFLSCVGDELGMADRTPRERQKMADCLSSLDAEFVLIDVGSGASRGVLDFFNLAHEAIVITSPEAASMRCTFRFIRNATYRRVQEQFGANEEVNSALARLRDLASSAQPPTMTKFLDLLRPKAPEVALGISDMLNGWRPFLLVNMAASEQELRSAEIIHTAAWKFLNVDLRSCGPIHFDASLRKSNQGMSLPDCSDPDNALALQIQHTALQLAAIDAPDSEVRRADTTVPMVPTQVMGLNDNLAFMGRALHVQTEDLGTAGNCITTQVFCDGRVILSTKSEYPSAMREQNQNDQVIELMRTQHFNVIRQIESRQSRHQSGLA